MQNHNILPGAGSGKDTKLIKFCPAARMDTELIKSVPVAGTDTGKMYFSYWHAYQTD